jgi:multiple antibiotic resistance protein
MGMDAFWLCFVPLFVAVDAFGVLPLFLSFTEGIEQKRLRTLITVSVITATYWLLILLIGDVV